MRGCQRPRISRAPQRVSSAGEDAIAAYEQTGNELLPWQRLVLRDALGEREDGRWAAFEIGLVVPRQNGKDEILAARELAGLFVWGERLIIHSAHKFDTALEHMERLVALIDSVPEFRKRVRSITRGNGKEAITLKDGARIRFRARTKSGGGRGYTGDCVIFNEAMELPDEIVGAVMPIMSARSKRRPGPQIWLAGSAVDQETMSEGIVLSRVRAEGIDGENDRFAYFEWSAEDDADPEDWRARAEANPSLGYLISPEHVELEWRSPSMSAHQFGVERMGQGNWFDPSEDAGRVISRDAWAKSTEIDPTKRILGRKFFAADADPDHRWASISVAGPRDDELFHVAVVDRRGLTDWVEGRWRELRGEHPGSRLVIDTRGPLSNLIPALKRVGGLIEAKTGDYADACADFVDAVPDLLRHPEATALDDAITAARKQPMGDRWKWSRKDSTADITPLVAASLAFWAATRRAGISQVIGPDDAALAQSGPRDLLPLEPEDLE